MYDKLFRTKSAPRTTAQEADPEHTLIRKQVISDSPAQASAQASVQASVRASVHDSGRVIALANEVEILRALHKFAWLTSRQIGEWVWPAASQQTQMARRTLARLKALEQVLVRTLPNGIPAYMLSASGAARLREHGVEARSGKDARTARWLHRAICNWHAITLRNIWGQEVYSEHELYTGRCPIGEWCGKLADTIQVRGGKFVWVEVEHSRRRPSDMQKLLHLLVHGPRNPLYAHDRELMSIQLVTTDSRLTDAISAALTKELDNLELGPRERHEIRCRTRICVLALTPGLMATDYPVWCELLLEAE